MKRRRRIRLPDGRSVPVILDPRELTHEERLALLRVADVLGPITLDPAYAAGVSLDQGRLG